MTALTRDHALELAAQASLSGYLGLFIGSGFARAATLGVAPTFRGLLESILSRLELVSDLDRDEQYHYKSYAQIASQLLREYSARPIPPERAADVFRQEICDICNLSPDDSVAEFFARGLSNVAPSWVVTTNYDLVIESLLPDAQTVLPSQALVVRPDRVPIYHLHGHRLYPSSIKVTEEDYVSLLGPIDYQRLKLPLLLAESTTVMIGYALGDMNVRAAMSWAQSFSMSQGLEQSLGQGLVIQALYVLGTPTESPYYGPNGELVIEISDIADFLTELGSRRESLAAHLVEVRKEIDQFLSDPSTAIAVCAAGEERAKFLSILGNALPFYPAARVVDFLSRSLDPVWERAREDGNFEHYNIYMKLLVDILEMISVDRCHPALLSYLADALERVGWFVSAESFVSGAAWSASGTWRSQHKRISYELKRELRSYAESHSRTSLLKLLSMANVGVPES